MVGNLKPPIFVIADPTLLSYLSMTTYEWIKLN